MVSYHSALTQIQRPWTQVIIMIIHWFLYFAKYFSKYSLPFLLTFIRLKHDRKYFKKYRKEILKVSSLTSPCFTNYYFSRQYFIYRIFFEFSTECYAVKILYDSHFLHPQDRSRTKIVGGKKCLKKI